MFRFNIIKEIVEPLSSQPLLGRSSSLLCYTPKLLVQSVRNINIRTFEIPDGKRLEISLTRIHGIGRRTARQLLSELSIENKIAKFLTPRERFLISEELPRFMIDRERKQFNIDAIERLKKIQCYRGQRHIDGLPCRGQRTRTNARTIKGRRVVSTVTDQPNQPQVHDDDSD